MSQEIALFLPKTKITIHLYNTSLSRSINKTL